MSEAVIDVRGLSRRFGALDAVLDLSFTVARGEIFGLLGSNGAGKTTVIKLLTTLLPPTAGDALVAGLSIRSAPHAVRRGSTVSRAASVAPTSATPCT